MKLRQIISNLKPKEVWGDSEREVCGIAYDSRQVKPGELFVCVPGLATDGHEFIKDAIRRGANALVISNQKYKPVDFPGPVLLVENGRHALSKAAEIFYGQPSRRLNLIGITGTNGKTTTAYLIASILRVAGKKVGLLGTIEYQIGDRILPASRTTPESLDLQRLLFQMVEEGCEYAVMEVSSHSLALERVRDCYFSGAVFTNLTPEHLDFHDDMDNYFLAKQRLFLQLDDQTVAVTNLSNAWGKRIVFGTKAKVYTYSRFQDSKVKLCNYKISREGIWAKIKIGEHLHEFRSPLLGDYNLENLMAAASLGLSQGVDWPTIAKGIGELTCVPGRFEPVNCGQKFVVIVDYAHTEDALRNLLNAARRLTKGQLITVFGCGGDRDKHKRPKMGKTAYELSDYVIITSDNPRSEDPAQIIKEIEAGILESGATKINYRICQERHLAIEEAIGLAKAKDTVVIAGKGHEDYQIIGDERLHFDDRKVARSILTNRISK